MNLLTDRTECTFSHNFLQHQGFIFSINFPYPKGGELIEKIQPVVKFTHRFVGRTIQYYEV
jgi:hypothetical protein